MSAQTAKKVVLDGLQPEYREALLHWAAQHRIYENDPVWALVDQGALIHEWQLESIRELEAAQRAATARIHQTSLAATKALRLAATAAREEVAEGLGDEVREMMATETRKALAKASHGGWQHKLLHWSGPLLLGLAVSLITVGWFTYNQPTPQDLKISRAVRDVWSNLPASAQQIIADALK